MKQQEDNIEKVRILEVEEGTSGTIVSAGYFDEEYIQELSGTTAAEKYDKMRRGDYQVQLALSAPINAILGGAWGVTPASSEEKDKEIADFVEFIFFEDLDRPFKEKLEEILSCVIFGYSVFEKVNKIVMGHSKWKNYLGYKKIAFRSQKTIEKWNFKNKELASVTQMAYGDLDSCVDMAIESLLIFTIRREGDNYEGISMLRSAYGAWFRKQLYLKLDAIGIEKTALGTTKGTYPSGMYGTPEYTRFKSVIKRLTSHQNNFVTVPDTGNSDGGKWDIEVIKLDYDAQKVSASIDREDKAILRAFVAGFLMLGQSGSSGSWSLSTDQSDFFLNGIVHIADMIAAKFSDLVKEVVDWKYGPQEKYPDLTHQGIKDKAGEEWQKIVCGFKRDGLIKADDTLEKAIRERYDMPEIDEETRREDPAPISPFAKPTDEEEDPAEDDIEEADIEDEKKNKEKEVKKQSEIKLSEVVKTNKKYGEKLKVIQKKLLTDILEDLIKQVTSKFENSTNINEIDSISDIKIRKTAPYQKVLRELLDEAASETQEQAEDLVKKNTKLSEVLLAKKKSALLTKTKKYNKVMSAAIATIQPNDIYKAVVLQFGSSINSTQDVKIIDNHLREAGENAIAKDTNAAGLVVSQTVAKARENYFFDDEIKKEIESFTYTNDNPKAAICVSLNGKTFRSDDASSYQFTPPLHHNACLENTDILTSEGIKKIKDIQVNDLVKTHTGKFQPVYEVMDRFEDKEYFVIELENGKIIEITGEHPVLTSRGWVQVFDLKLNDNIICLEDIDNA